MVGFERSGKKIGAGGGPWRAARAAQRGDGIMRALMVAVGALALPAAVRAADGPDFNREVRPILAAHCFKCHGPDDKARKAKLRLEVRTGALKVIEPGKPDDSELVRRILATDDDVMPPPQVKNPLSDKQK